MQPTMQTERREVDDGTEIDVTHMMCLDSVGVGGHVVDHEVGQGAEGGPAAGVATTHTKSIESCECS